MNREIDRQKALEQADVAAMKAHAYADATGSHARLAESIWRLLQGLGARAGGRVLAFGADPQILLTGDPLRPEPRDANGFPVYDRWQGTLGVRGPQAAWETFPVTRYPLNLATTRPFDVAIASMPNNDVRLRSAEARAIRHHRFHLQAAGTLKDLAPGGHAVFLVNHSVLDFPDPGRWAPLAGIADFLGAVRLPSSALRAARACDAPVDVLVLRRRQSPHPDTELRFPGVQWSSQDGLHETTHFTTHPDRVLGTRKVGTDYWGMKQLAVHDPDRTWPGRLEAVFAEIARQHGPRTASPPGAGSTPPSLTPRRSTPRRPDEAPDLGL
ncbi:hypothetical protein C8K30_115114 [Promicromonospora sp. AC04]|uniref:hypothetical protein n=1 Tax=Promicromonospora sp. AC04 TaxID=2135723 RepID=UPI000D335E02|nr:hypothetical protein [Promicromonospora sp. AC04]PUB20903.1 hypothetical protein C8K30_115114 [Promicromonospora sp. AC04]